jgi:hypothetical protein
MDFRDPNAHRVLLHEFSYWSPVLGCYAIRFWTYSEDHAEYYAVVPAPREGKSMRQLRQAVGARLDRAIQGGEPSGEVKFND